MERETDMSKVKIALISAMVTGLLATAAPAFAATIKGQQVGSDGCGAYTTETQVGQPGGPLVSIGTAGADFSDCGL